MPSIVLIADNLRSAHNVGSLLRTADGIGVEAVYLTGYTPHPSYEGDNRMPHIAAKLTRQIEKTALGAETSVHWHYQPDVVKVIEELRTLGYSICALEQDPHSISLQDYVASQSIALLIGNEVTGIEPELLEKCDQILQIPMHGQKESFNVVQATAMALYHLRFSS